MKGAVGLNAAPAFLQTFQAALTKTHETSQNLVRILLVIIFLGSLAGCDKLGLHGKEDTHGHSHE